MTDTVTLAHLSDVHLAPVRGLTWRHLNVKRGLGYLNWQRSRRRVHRRASLDRVVADLQAHKPDHIAVTGDLINLGLPAEYEAAHAWLEGLGPPRDVTVVPGNHDIYTHVRDDPGVERWGDYMRADAWGAQLGPAAAGGFPFVRRIGPLALICLNSAEKTPPFVAAGRLGDAQIAALGDLLERTEAEGLIRVVLIHHPPLPGQAPARRALRDAAALAHVLTSCGAELVLHGHNHRDNHADFAWAGGRIPVLGVASGSGGRLHKGEPLGRYNLLRITRTDNGAHIECTTRGLDATGAGVEQVDRKLLLGPGPSGTTERG
jgi:3',5'-cyclic AMP phosphodiesterase CpdA